ncbi:MAG: hypothetical protein AB7I42_25170 [Bradyrhizobium sp.]|uniref:hypothetical protein n=1 Tax=Bradyrhizobium sp. TaxID=376 RepID=UPI003D104D15
MTLDSKGLEAAAWRAPGKTMEECLSIAEPIVAAYLASAGEPVAWQWYSGSRWHTAEKPSVSDPETYARAQAGGSRVRPIYATPIPAPAPVQVKALDDDQIMEIIKEVAPWKTEPQLNDLLTYEKSPPLFPQATYDVPSYRATTFVRAVEKRIRSCLTPPEPSAVGDDYPDTSDLRAVNQALREQVSELADEIKALSVSSAVGEVTEVGKWAIDNSTSSPILTYDRCSVIQDEQAHYVMGLVTAALSGGWRDSAAVGPILSPKGE